jgi:hypothetical protein
MQRHDRNWTNVAHHIFLDRALLLSSIDFSLFSLTRSQQFQKLRVQKPRVQKLSSRDGFDIAIRLLRYPASKIAWARFCLAELLAVDYWQYCAPVYPLDYPCFNHSGRSC